MAGILESLSAMATPEVLGQIGKMTGVDPALLSKGLGAVSATTLGSMANSAKTPEGAEALFKKLPTDADASASTDDLVGSFMKSVTGSSGGTSADMMNSILGSGTNAIAGTLSKTLGFNVAPLLTMAVPAVLGMATKAAKSAGLDAAGLSKMLTDQTKEFMDNPSNKETAAVVNSALKAGETASKLRASYTDAEWETMRSAPLAAIALVAAASPSKGKGAGAEVAAAAGAIIESADAAEPTTLLGTAFGGGPTEAELNALDGSTMTKADAIKRIQDGVAIVGQKNPNDLPAYRAMIERTGLAVAEATKEGGFLGIGGKLVSPEEEAALAEIKTAVG
jgi:hypothetical protein